MASVGRQINWSGVGFTPLGGSVSTVSTVQSVRINRRGQMVTGRGDANFFPVLKKVVASDPMCEITAQDGTLAASSAFQIGTTGSIAATHNDAKSGATSGTGSGALTYALSNAVLGDIGSGGQHLEIGEITLTFESYSNDGFTSPLALTVN